MSCPSEWSFHGVGGGMQPEELTCLEAQPGTLGAEAPGSSRATLAVLRLQEAPTSHPYSDPAFISLVHSVHMY